MLYLIVYSFYIIMIYDCNWISIRKDHCQKGYGADCFEIVDRCVRRYPKLNAAGERMAIRTINPELHNLEAWMKRR